MGIIVIPGWWFQPLWNIWLRQLGWWYIPNWMEKQKNVPKHQPDTVCLQLSYVYHYVYYLDVYRSPHKFHMLDVPLKGPRQSQLPLFVTENSPGLRKQPAPQQGQSAVAMGSSWSPPAGRWTLPAVQRGPCALQPDADPEHWGSWRWEFSCLAKWSGWFWGKQNARIWLGETKHSSTIHPGYLREKWGSSRSSKSLIMLWPSRNLGVPSLVKNTLHITINHKL